ncbi:recombinase family protein [Paenibacillus sp. FSL E2-0201]|uniref:recombinase family protein n=1 Tax=Paenibacillus sp. FSL E2-0201 TaxID=2954726 RepID=UPI0030DD7704
MSVAIYVRVSTALQIDNTSLDIQVDLCKKRALELGFFESNIRIYREEGATGEDIDVRPVMTTLRQDVADGLIKLVICTHPDRFSRDMTDKLIVMREFEKYRVDIKFTDTEFSNSPEGILFFNILSAIANYELSLIKKRTVRGRERAVKEQKKIMPMRVAPFGYDKDDEGQLIVNQREAQYVQMIYEWYVFENLTMREIGSRLYDSGVMPKRGESKNWGASSIGRILTSEIYIGNYYYNRRKSNKIKGQVTESGRQKRTINIRDREEWIQVSIPALVDEALYELAQKQKIKNTTNKHVGNQKYQYLLKSLLKCAHCGRTWDATTYSGRENKNTGKREQYRCYRCPNLNPKKYGPEISRCPSQVIRAELLEEFIWGEVTRLVTDPEYFIKHIQGKAENGMDDIQDRIDLIKKQLETKEKEKEKLKIMFKRDVITEEEMVKEMKQINIETSVLKDELNKYQNHIAAQQKDQLEIEHILKIIEIINDKMGNPDELDFDFKRHIIEMLFEQILIKCEDNNEITITSVGTFDKLLGKSDVRLCTQRQKIRQHRRRHGGSNLHRHHWLD